jgi:hypothetical protein
MKLIVNTEYQDIVRYLFSGYRLEKEFPIRDNFFIVKNISHKENMLLDRFNNYVIVSKNFFTEVWGKEEIFQYLIDNKRTRKKTVPQFDGMSDAEFEKYIKIMYLTGTWAYDDSTEGLLELFKNIDSGARYKEYFTLLSTGMDPMYIFYGILTMIKKSLGYMELTNVNNNFFILLKNKNTVLSRNIVKSLERWAQWDKNVDDDMKVLRFIKDIGDRA